jgi:hypothetical protein
MIRLQMLSRNLIGQEPQEINAYHGAFPPQTGRTCGTPTAALAMGDSWRMAITLEGKEVVITMFWTRLLMAVLVGFMAAAQAWADDGGE